MESKFLTFHEKRIHYLKLGQGKPLVLVHGWGGSGQSLLPIARLLADTFQCFVIDLPGFGKSDAPDPIWGVPEYAEVILALLQREKLEKIHYFGHSFGGALGVYLAATYPNILTSLAVCSASYRRQKRHASVSPGILKKLFMKLPWIRKLLYRVFFPNSDLFKHPELESTFKAIVSQDLSELASKIAQPLLVLWGDQDVDTPVSDAYFLKEQVPRAILKIIEGVGHGLPLRQPEKTAEILREFFESCS